MSIVLEQGEGGKEGKFLTNGVHFHAFNEYMWVILPHKQNHRRKLVWNDKRGNLTVIES